MSYANNEQFETKNTKVTVQDKNTCPESPEQDSVISQSLTA